MKEEGLMEKIVSLSKRRGFIFQGSEIYGGLAGTWDYGPLGVALKKNIENLWWKMFVDSRRDMYGLDAAILMNAEVWKASGHVDGFQDPLVEDLKTKERHRLDHLLEAAGIETKGLSLEALWAKAVEKKIRSTKGNELGKPRYFNMMFETRVGAISSETEDAPHSVTYLRPETAQGMFVNFKNIIDVFHPRLPFGIAQIGKAFRNEIAPRDFIFRVRELEIMELEYFIKEGEWEKLFSYWLSEAHRWFSALGFASEDIKEVEVDAGDRAHYSKRTVDFHFRFPHKFDEIGGIAYRTDFDLKNHSDQSGVDLAYLDPQTNEKITPHVIEPTFGLGRHLLAVLAKAYSEDVLGEEKRVYLRFPPHLAPIKAAVFPLLKNKPELVKKAEDIFGVFKESIPQMMFDDNGNIGKRYRRQDEIGTPFCITIDFDTLEDGTVTLRDRDSGKQERVSPEAALQKIKEAIQ